ncbi:MAG: class I SAM-dependent methyltransferase [Bdellovibrionota bacterium]
MAQTECLNCKFSEHEVKYKGPIRAGTWGHQTSEDQQVLACKRCGLARLEHFPDQKKFYSSAEYRNAYNGSVQVQDYFKLHDHEQSPRIANIGVEKFRGARVLDYGCGGGAFLDLVKGVAQETFGIEPCLEFHESLGKRGHQIFESAQDALSRVDGSMDVVLSFGVIEHVVDPLEYLQNIKRLLKPGRSAYLETDNLNEILMNLEVREFEPFFYRTAHLWYFTAETLKSLCERAGLEVRHIGFRHTYDLSNAMVWMRDRRPTGLNKLGLFDDSMNAMWRSSLEARGLADLIFFEVGKG